MSPPSNLSDEITNFGQDITEVDISVNELSTKVGNLLDNVQNPKFSRDCILAIDNSQRAIDKAKIADRKLTLSLCNDHTAPLPLKLQKNKLSSTLSSRVQQFNELSKKIHTIIDQPPPPQRPKSLDNTPKDNRNFVGIDLNVTDADNLWSMKQVQQGLETTQIMFDELDCMVRQQQQHFNTLESGVSSTNHFTKEAADQLHKAYSAQRRRAKRTWTFIAILACFIVCMVYVRQSPTPVVETLRGASASRRRSAEPTLPLDDESVVVAVDMQAAKQALDKLKSQGLNK